MAAVTPLDTGTLTVPKWILTTGVDVAEQVDVPAVCYLVEAERTILVDTSFGDVAEMADHYPGFDCRRPDGETPAARLAEHGYDPGDVDDVVLTHLHWDHCYNLEQFDADVYVQRRELQYAREPYPHQAGGYANAEGQTPPWADVELTPVEGEHRLTDSVTLFPTPGHSVGHQSVAVETDDGTVVAAADAVPTYENLEGTDDVDYIPGLAVDELAWWDSASAVDARAGTVLPGHEPSLF